MQCHEGELSYCLRMKPQKGVGTGATLLPRKCCCCAAACVWQCAGHLKVVSGAYQAKNFVQCCMQREPKDCLPTAAMWRKACLLSNDCVIVTHMMCPNWAQLLKL